GDDNGQPKAMLGVNADDTGSLQLFGQAEALAQISSKGVVIANAERKQVAMLRQEGDRGYLELRSSKEVPNAAMWASDEEGGTLDFYGPAGNRGATISTVGGPGKVTFFGNNGARSAMGVSADDAGLVLLNAPSGQTVMLHGIGGFKTKNPSGQEVIDIGVDPH